MSMRARLLGLSTLAAGLLLALPLGRETSAQVTCNHYRMHPSGCGCGTPCICWECLLCDS
jgi:hypothetical protein